MPTLPATPYRRLQAQCKVAGLRATGPAAALERRLAEHTDGGGAATAVLVNHTLPGAPDGATANPPTASGAGSGGSPRLASKQNLVAVAVFIDLLAVALVVPLLPQRMEELGVDAARVGMIASVYSLAQIVGGVVLAVVADRGLLSRRGVLLLNFAGAAVSYAIVGFADSVWLLLLSRVVVGLVKQTTTTTSAMVADWAHPRDRAAAIGRLGTAMTLGWMAGQSLGGVLATRVHMSAPPAAAVLLYAIDAVWVTTTLPSGEEPTGGAKVPAPSTPRPGAGGTVALVRSVLQDASTVKVLALQGCVGVADYGIRAMMSQYERRR